MQDVKEQIEERRRSKKKRRFPPLSPSAKTSSPDLKIPLTPRTTSAELTRAVTSIKPKQVLAGIANFDPSKDEL